MRASPFVRARLVLLDLVGTLIYGRAGIGVQYAEAAARVGVLADPARLEAAFRAAMAAAPVMAFPGATVEESAVLEREWWRSLVGTVVEEAGVEALRSDPDLFNLYFDRLFDHFTTEQAWQLYDDVLPALEAMKRAGLQTGLVTNYDTRVFEVLSALGLAPLLDSVTIPAMVGAAKPDRSIFERALAHHGLRPEEAICVGDSWEDDYLGSEAAGMVPVLLDRHARHAEKAGINRIETLTELLR